MILADFDPVLVMRETFNWPEQDRQDQWLCNHHHDPECQPA
jgi:hypothetical protein